MGSLGSVALGDAPVNLPVAPGVFSDEEEIEQDIQATDEEDLTELENHAHAAHVLLSSDAMRYLARAASKSEQLQLLDKVIDAAKVSFPSDDDWVVVNLSRMEQLISELESREPVASVLAATPTQSMTAGSLAEAIAMGNVVAAYQLIEHRPMIALSDAAADFDALYRSRNGEQVQISNMLRQETAEHSVSQIRTAILALTSALDGTYTDEASAVKMAILKAVKALDKQD